MLNTKLFHLMIHLTSEDMKAVRNFLNSKHKKNTHIFKLFNYIDKQYPNLEENKAKLGKEKIYTHVFGREEPFNNDSMNTLRHNLLKDIEDFLMIREIEIDKTLRDVLLSRIFKKRGMDELFKKHNTNSRQAILKAPILEHHHCHALAQLSQDATFHRDTPGMKADYEKRFKKTERYIDMRYLLDKLRMICVQITADGIINIKTREALITLDIERLNGQLKDDNSLAKLYLDVLKMYKNEDDRIYETIKAKVTNMSVRLLPENRYNLLILLINYASKKYKENKIEYRNEILQLYEFAFDKQLLIEDGYIADINYLNLIDLFASIGKYDVAKKIIKKSDKLPPSYRKDVRAMAQAMLSYAQGKYDETIRILKHAGELKMLNIAYKLTERSLMLRAYYEEVNYNVLDDYAKASFVFIKRREKELAEETCEANRNFYKFVHAAGKIKHRKGKITINELQKMIDAQAPLVYIAWCRKKIEELSKK